MDPLTHGLLGASIGYALFGRKLGKKSAAVGALAGIAPDIDHFVSSKTDVLLYVQVHRSFTHSFLISFLGAWITTLPWTLQKKYRDQWKIFWFCAWPAYLSHGLLDASTTYGTQLLWPFSNHRFGWDLIAVIDLVFTAVLASGLWLALKKSKRVFTFASLIFCAAYLSFGGLQRERASDFQQKIAASRGQKIERGEVMPTLANLNVWRSIYLCDGKLYSDRIRVGLFSEPTFREGTSLPLVTKSDLTEIEREGNETLHAFDRFAWFSGDWVARSPLDSTVLADMRYSISTKAFDPIWGIRFVRDGEKIKVEWISRQLKRKLALDELWSEIIGTNPDYHRLQ